MSYVPFWPDQPGHQQLPHHVQAPGPMSMSMPMGYNLQPQPMIHPGHPTFSHSQGQQSQGQPHGHNQGQMNYAPMSMQPLANQPIVLIPSPNGVPMQGQGVPMQGPNSNQNVVVLISSSIPQQQQQPPPMMPSHQPPNQNPAPFQSMFTPPKTQPYYMQVPVNAPNVASPGGVIMYSPQASPNASHSVSPSTSLTAAPMAVSLAQNASVGSRNDQPLRPPPRYVFGAEAPSPSVTPNTSLTSAGVTPSSSTGRIPVNNSIWGYALVDPLHPRLQRVPIASSAVVPTAGLNAYDNDVVASSTKPCLSAVCLRYNSESGQPDGGCPLGAACPNFHVNAQYLEKARKVWDPICCGQHNCYFTNEMIRANLVPHLTNCRFVLIIDRAEVELSIQQLAFTVGLEQLPLRAGKTRVITGKNLCRLHFDSKCKWTKDCGHVHVCRELFKYLQAFHYPSLHFLLMTETNVETLLSKIQQKMILEFLRSDCSKSLIKSLLDAGKTAAIEALRKCGASIPTPETTTEPKANTTTTNGKAEESPGPDSSISFPSPNDGVGGKDAVAEPVGANGEGESGVTEAQRNHTGDKENGSISS